MGTLDLTNLVQLEINENLRNISIPKKGVVFGVDGDIEVNRVAFILPKYYSNFDMTEFSARVNYVNANGEANYYEATDMAAIDDETAIFSWLMTSDVTSYIGEVRFSVHLYKQIDDKYIQKFGTRPATGKVLEGLDVESYVTPEQQQTLLEKMESRFNEYVQGKILEIDQDIDRAKNEALDEIEEAKNDVDSLVENGKSEISSLLSSTLDDIKDFSDERKQEISTLTEGKLVSIDDETAKQLKNIELAGTTETEKIKVAFSSAVLDIQKEGQKQVSSVQSEGTKQVQNIGAAKDSSLKDIGNAKTDAIKSVNDQAQPIVDKVEQLKQNVNDKSDSVNAAYEQMQKLHCIEISEKEPTNDRAGLWVNPENEEEINIPEIKDDEVNNVDTWSSQKINDEVRNLTENIENTVLITPEQNIHKIYNDRGIGYTNTEYNATDLVRVINGSIITFSSNVPSGYHAILLYDNDKNVIDTYFSGKAENQQYIINNKNASYIRFQSRNLTYYGNTVKPEFKIQNSIFNISNIISEIIEDSKNKVKSISIKKESKDKFSVTVPYIGSEKKVIYNFVKYLKTWDSLSYTDKNGVTQTASDVISADYWNNDSVYDGDGNYIAQGNSNFISKLKNAPAHAGYGHGNEVARNSIFLADGAELDIENMEINEIKKCSSFRIITQNDIFEVGGNTGANTVQSNYPSLDENGEPVINFKHTMEMWFEIGNVVNINNKLRIMRDGITFEQCHGVMLECNFGTFSHISCNNFESTLNTIDDDGNTSTDGGSETNFKIDVSQACNMVEMYGKNFFIKQEIKPEESNDFYKFKVYFMFYNNRLKCYFQPIVTLFGKHDNEAIREFNSGDIINIAGRRTIEL